MSKHFSYKPRSSDRAFVQHNHLLAVMQFKQKDAIIKQASTRRLSRWLCWCHGEESGPEQDLGSLHLLGSRASQGVLGWRWAGPLSLRADVPGDRPKLAWWGPHFPGEVETLSPSRS